MIINYLADDVCLIFPASILFFFFQFHDGNLAMCSTQHVFVSRNSIYMVTWKLFA